MPESLSWTSYRQKVFGAFSDHQWSFSSSWELILCLLVARNAQSRSVLQGLEDPALGAWQGSVCLLFVAYFSQTSLCLGLMSALLFGLFIKSYLVAELKKLKSRVLEPRPRAGN